ncbi:MAG: hypothetical protein ACHQTE_00355 [Candidatus Saccharimonadales bacterium]
MPWNDAVAYLCDSREECLDLVDEMGMNDTEAKRLLKRRAYERLVEYLKIVAKRRSLFCWLLPTRKDRDAVIAHNILGAINLSSDEEGVAMKETDPPQYGELSEE